VAAWVKKFSGKERRKKKEAALKRNLVLRKGHKKSWEIIL